MKTSVWFKIFARFNEKKKKQILNNEKEEQNTFLFVDRHEALLRQCVSSDTGTLDRKPPAIGFRRFGYTGDRGRLALPPGRSHQPRSVEIVLVAARVLKTNEISNNNTENIIRFLCESSERKRKSYTL